MRTARGYPRRPRTLGPRGGADGPRSRSGGRWSSAHEQRVDASRPSTWPARADGRRHPVADFLFTYYSYRPAQLRRWHPGRGRRAGRRRAAGGGLALVPTGSTATAPAWTSRRCWPLAGTPCASSAACWRATAARPAQLGCFGLHEWAMVYRQAAERACGTRTGRCASAPAARTRSWSSTRSAARTSTPSASSRRRPGRCNALHPTRETQADLEQPGCLHANMDLYKWAYKLGPAVPSELVAGLLRAGPRGARAGHARVAVRPARARLRAGADRDQRGQGAVRRRAARLRRARHRRCAPGWWTPATQLLGAGASPSPAPHPPARA